MLDEETLRRLYYEENMSQAEIAEEVGTNQPTICYAMDKYDMEAYRTKQKDTDVEKLRDADWLLSELEDRSASDIGREVGCTYSNVCYWRDKHLGKLGDD